MIAIAAACGGNGEGTPGPGETPDGGDETPDEQTPTVTADPEALLEQLWNAINDGDAAAAAELFAKDAVFEDYNHGPPDAFSGRDAILDFLQDRAVNLSLSVTPIDLETSGGTATGRIERSSLASLRISGFERLIELITVEVRGSEISLLRLLPDLADAETAEWQALRESGGIAEPPLLPRSTSPGAVILSLDSTDGAGQSGEALLRAFTIADGPSRTEIFIVIQPGPEGGFQPVHIHEGSCDDLRAIVYPLGSLISGRSSTTSVALLNDLLAGDFAIAVHESAESLDNIVACGDIAVIQPAE
ncbi:MAG: nuclear transport factor 2 family protein [Chloroflexi bacterium]|nr:nuclear transport factor 2 family protein [Chloroflexota bacterium]